MAKQSKFRKLINDLHLWIGLLSGLFIFIICFSGTMLTFSDSIRKHLSTPIVLEKTDKPLSLNKLSHKVKDLNKGKINSFTIADDNSPYVVNLKKGKEDRRGTNFSLDQYSGKLYENEKTWYDDFYRFNFKLHRWLLLEDTVGRPIVGVATLCFVFLTLSGLILWVPKKMKASWRCWKAGFCIKTKAHWKRLNQDLHNVLGFYTFVFILIMGLTGLCWSFEWYKDGASEVLQAKVFDRGADKKFKSDTILLLPKKNIDEIYLKSNQDFPYQGITKISLPQKESDAFIVTKFPINSVATYNTDKIIYDQNGEILKKELFADKTFGQKIASLIRPLHTGEIYGIWSEIIYFITCLIGTSLPITGTLIWWNKRRKTNKK